MARKIGDCPPIPAIDDAWKGYEKRELTIQVVTPMFGGGVKPGEPDPITPIRATSIRGHLRFWWRATCGPACGEVEAMRQREAKIWGDTKSPSKVLIQVHDEKTTSSRPCATYELNQRKKRYDRRWDEPFRSSLVYALFPFQGKDPKRGESQPEEVPKLYVPSSIFMLRIIYPKEYEADVESAAMAWVNFGGLGARTRRGCGSLSCNDFAPANSEALDSLFKTLFCQTSDVLQRSAGVPRTILYKATEVPIHTAWEQAIALLHEFRQGPSEGRNGRCGPSWWPEADTVRRLTGRQPKGNGPEMGFPRTAFGLPIIFHFQPGKGEPPDTELYPILSDRDSCGRMSSPLLIKPLVLQSGKAFPVILRFGTSLPDCLGLRETKLRKERLPEGADASAIVNPNFTNTVRPLGRSKGGSAIEAFMAFAKERGFIKEVVL